MPGRPDQAVAGVTSFRCCSVQRSERRPSKPVHLPLPLGSSMAAVPCGWA